MSLDFERSDEPKADSWDELQSKFSPSEADFSLEPTVRKTAAGPMEQAVRSVTDTLFAGSATINEEFEIKRHIKELVDEGHPYPAIEKSLLAYGYNKPKIRRAFFKVTGIDPVQAYLDVSTYTIPPDSVPRYNYGWGFSKNKEADYFFILPFTWKYAIYKQTGLNREIVFEDLSVEKTREELKSHVKDVRMVTPDSLDTESDIIQRVASINLPQFDTEEANKTVAEVSRLKLLDEPTLAKQMITSLKAEGKLSQADFDAMSLYINAEDPSDMSGAEKEHQHAMEKYQKGVENKTIDDMMNDLKVPQNFFESGIEEQNKVNMKELTGDAYDLLEEIGKSIPGFSIEPVGTQVDMVDVQSVSTDDTNHIDAGSVQFVVNIVDLKNQAERKGLVIMFIQNGKLQYTGKFKGEDNREYALSTPGINAYMDAIETTPVEDLHYSPHTAPTTDVPGPYR